MKEFQEKTHKANFLTKREYLKLTHLVIDASESDLCASTQLQLFFSDNSDFLLE